MTRFIGGPYDGQDLPIDERLLPIVHLPPPGEVQSMLSDPLATSSTNWPFVYEVDGESDPPVYRFVESTAQ